MQLTPLLSIYAVVTGFFGVALLGVPRHLVGVYGAPPLDTLETIARDDPIIGPAPARARGPSVSAAFPHAPGERQ